ncbi:PREDICTED: uncharacterized protein LOC109352869 [Lupinus angustifolius]|uniref:uncharacterized protein LOC109352869 n=1 Tax=Lupinus angustifolius TaxID=3871 RepID=UPI00092EA4ED|nr:PREDICTED: uncharacterized protein LOC109352869 [Lupinus angustifolius]
MNKIALLKLAWDMMSSNDKWAIFYRRIFGCNKDPPNKIQFWKDNWLGEPLVDCLGISDDLLSALSTLCSDFILDSRWMIPTFISNLFPEVSRRIASTGISSNMDKLIWLNSENGILDLRNAYIKVDSNPPGPSWCKLIWANFIPPSQYFLVWRLFHNKVPSDDNLQQKGCSLASMCSLCRSSIESFEHLFLSCPFATYHWC